VTQDEIWDAIVASVREEIGDPTLDVRREMTASDISGWDSVTHVRIVLNVEDRIGASLDISKTYRAKTIGDLIPVFKQAMAS